MEREEIQKELEELPREWLPVFIARINAQSLSRLLYKVTPEEPLFAYWKQSSRHRRLISVLLMVVQAEFHVITGGKNSFKTLFNALDIENAYRDTIVYHALTAIENFLFSIYPPDHIVNNTAILAREGQETGLDIAKELTFLKKYLNSGKTVTDYIYQTLYTSQSPEWLQCGKEFVQVLREYGHGFDIWADWFQGRIDGIPTDKKFIEAVAYLFEEVLAQKPAHINAYLKSLDKAAGTLNRVRVIFLGDGGAGKTSLIRVLNGLEVIPGEEKMTPGIDISNWKVPGTDITAHFWDFGGQVVAHATHQFFLRSQCLYILLLDGRTNEQAEYWLEHVRAFGSKAPVMLVGNKADLCAVNLDMARLKEKHDNVLGFYPLSCTKYQDEYALEFQRFQKDLSKEAAELGVHQIRFGKAHLAVLDELTDLSGTESFLPKIDWLALCAGKGLAEQGDLNQAWLLDLFDKLGVIVHFPKLAALDSYILNPRWLTYGVYTLLYSKEAKKKKGRLQESEIIRILSEAEVRDHLGNILSYPLGKAWIILKAMEAF
ncbi:MAG: hypothetical protein D3925_08330, partial [Candidatus Electrothrix sp. AR5]|nr:hypothetical protein [Candidatus Electrothrix sp. AR5]